LKRRFKRIYGGLAISVIKTNKIQFAFWPVVKLTDVIKDIIDNRGRSAPLASSGIPLIATNCIKENGLYPTKEKIRFISQKTYSEWFRSHPLPGDVIIVNKGTPGCVCQVPDPVNFCIAQDMVALRPDTKIIDPDYLLSAMRSKSFKNQVEALHVGTLIPHLKKHDFQSLTIPLPQIDIQKQIGKIYCNLSRKIESNWKINEILESIARAIFKSWFIDFDPVRAKAEGRKPSGLDEETAALFPDSFEDSELGEIPKGWRICYLSDIIEVIGGGTPKTNIEEYWEGDILWFSVVDAPNDSDVFVIDTERHITQAGVDNSSTTILPVGTSIITARGTVGKLALVSFPMAMNQSCYGIRGKDGYSDLFTHFLLKHMINNLQNKSHGTVFNTITTQTFNTIKILAPPVNFSRIFELKIQASLNLIKENLYGSKTLANIRDTLLPKLLSGEIRILMDKIEEMERGTVDTS